jgi:hypothetical protein
MEQKFQYKVSKPADDYRDAVIEKSGMSSVEFTIAELADKQNKWSQEKRQLEGQITIEQAKVDNILHHHPWLKKMPEKKQFTVWMFYEAMKGLTELQKQRDMRVSALGEYQAEKEHVMEVLGFQKSIL